MTSENVVKETTILAEQVLDLFLQVVDEKERSERFLETMRFELGKIKQRIDSLQLRAQVELGEKGKKCPV